MQKNNPLKDIRISAELFDSLRIYCDNKQIRFQDFVEDALENAPDAEEQFRIWEENRKPAAHIAQVREHAA